MLRYHKSSAPFRREPLKQSHIFQLLGSSERLPVVPGQLVIRYDTAMSLFVGLWYSGSFYSELQPQWSSLIGVFVQLV